MRVRRRRPLFISVKRGDPITATSWPQTNREKQRHNPNVSVKTLCASTKKLVPKKWGLAPWKAPFFLGVGSVAPHKALTALQKRKTDDLMGFNPNFSSAKQCHTYGDGSPIGNRKHPDEGYKARKFTICACAESAILIGAFHSKMWCNVCVISNSSSSGILLYSQIVLFLLSKHL